MTMKRILLAGLVLCGIWLGGCSRDDGALTQVSFRRGSGSTWGNQLYVQVNAAQIIRAEYIPAGSSELVTRENIPITPAQWQTLCDLVDAMQLQKKSEPLFSFGTKVDGTDFRELTVTRGGKAVECRWPGDEKAAALEAFLEDLIKEVCS